MRRFFFCGLLIVVSGAMGTRAESNQTQSDKPKEIADSIVVTANRVGVEADKSIWPTAAIKKIDIADQTSLERALEGRAGVDIRSYNGEGSVSTLSSWGTFNRHMLLLYNGRVVKDYSVGGFSLAEYSTAEFDRVEFVKGPQSAFYGSDAIGGVVNLITPTTLADRIDVTSRVGNQGLIQNYVSLSRKFNHFGVGAWGEMAQADNDRDNAGSEHLLGGIRTDYVTADGRHSFSGSARYYEDSLGVPGPVPDANYIPVYGSRESNSLFANQTDENIALDLNYRFYDESIGEARLDLFWERKKLDYNDKYNYMSYYNVWADPDSVLNIDSVDVLSHTDWNERSSGILANFSRSDYHNTFAAGVDFLSGSIDVTTDDTSFSFNTLGPYAPSSYSYQTYNKWQGSQDQFDLWSAVSNSFNRWVSLDLSGRVQFVSHRKTQPSYNIGLSSTPIEFVRVNVGYGYAFRLPSISEQFADDVFTAGNSDLNPETSRSWVVSLSANTPDKKFSGRISFFDQRVDSLIQYQYDATIFRSVPRNVDKYKSHGLDIDLYYESYFGGSATLSTVWQNAKQTSGGGSEIDAYYVPDLKARLDLNQAIHSIDLGLNFTYTDERYIVMYGGDEKTIADVLEIGAGITVRATDFLRLSLIGYDLTDQKRPDQFGFTLTDGDYPSPGRRIVFVTKISL